MPSQAMASSSAKCKADRPPENIISGQSFTMCDIVCEGAPQEQDGSEAWFQRTRFAAHRPWPARKWFNVDHKRRRRSNPECAMEGYTISERFVTSEAAHSSVHFCRGDTSSCCGSSGHTERLDVRRTSEWNSTSDIRGRVTVEDLVLLRSWFVAAIRRMWGGVMWLRTGNHGTWRKRCWAQSFRDNAHGFIQLDINQVSERWSVPDWGAVFCSGVAESHSWRP